MHGSFVNFVIFRGLTEQYPRWFRKSVIDDLTMDSDRYTFWVPQNERNPDYYEKVLVEDYSVFLENRRGEIHCTTMEAFDDLYSIFKYDAFKNGGVAAFKEDCIEYVECVPGVLTDEYPDWFYEYYTEVVVFPDEETIFLDQTGDISITEHCVFLRNKFGEIRKISYNSFLKYYNPGVEQTKRMTIFKDL